MINRKVSLSEIIEVLGDLLLNTCGPTENVYVDNLADLQHVNETTLDWVGNHNKEQQAIVEQTKAHVILVGEDVVFSETLQDQKKTLLVVKNPKMALALIGNSFFVVTERPEIHPTAIIDPEATIGKDVYIGPYVVIGKATIGDNCRICSSVRIYDDVIIGHHCHIKDGAVIGGEGYGYEKDSDGNRFRFPQIGGVKIGNYVDIGSHTCIDRGALSVTIIEDYAKIDNLCHLGHNDHVGKNVAIVACTEMSGSVVVGDNTWIGPNTTIRDQCKIGENTLIGMGSSIIMNIGSNEVWSGYPARKINEKK